MSDGMYLLVAAGVALVFVVLVLASNPERNPHVDARRQRRWWTRDHD